MAGHKIAFFGQVAPADHTKVRQAVYEFGYLSIGINLPQSAEDQFNAGQPWTVVSGSPNIGGHCVVVCGYDTNYAYLWTWGALWKMDWDFWDAFVEEAWAVISVDWVNTATGIDRDGVDKYALGLECEAVFGTNPFPAPPLPPAPVPPVPVKPVPSVNPFLAFWRWLISLVRL
jgi:hypothetical protein